tara:strand:+ start:466 stop:1770 length:1305 start_codon:yes stop_codon:yes gene_type:complete
MYRFLNKLKLVLKKNLAKNIFTQIKIFISTIWFQIIFTPLMLYSLDVEKFSLWIFLFSFPLFFLVFEITVTGPTRNEMSILYNQGRKDNLEILFHNSIFLLVLNSLLILFLFILFINFIDNEIIQDNYITAIILIISVIVVQFHGLFNILLTYKGSEEDWNNNFFLFKIINPVVIPFVAFLSKDLLFCSLILLGLNIIQFYHLYFKYINSKNEISLSFKIANISLLKLKYLLNKSYGFNIELISNIIKHPGLIFILGLKHDILSTAIIASAKTMFYFVPLKLVTIITTPLELEFTKYFSLNKSKEELNKIIINAFAIIILFTLIFCLFCYFYGIFFFNLWVNNKIFLNSVLLVLILLDVFFTIVGNFFILLQKSHNKYKEVSFIEILINVSIFIYFYNFMNNLSLNQVYLTITLASLTIMIIKIISFIKYVIIK